MVKITPVPIDESGNNERLKTFTFDEADAPMLMRAISVGIATAMMCGGKESIGRMKYYKEQLSQFCPAAKYLDQETDLCEIVIAGTKSPTWSIQRVKRHHWSDQFKGKITVGDRSFSLPWHTTEKEIVALTEMLTHILPLTCEKVEVEDLIDPY
jgi:hypothetical protein